MTVAHNPSSFDCATCQTRHCDESIAAPYPIWRIEEDGKVLDESNVCYKPMHLADTQSAHLWFLYCNYANKNIMPENTGADDLWERHRQAFEVCHQFVIQHEKDKAK